MSIQERLRSNSLSSSSRKSPPSKHRSSTQGSHRQAKKSQQVTAVTKRQHLCMYPRTSLGHITVTPSTAAFVLNWDKSSRNVRIAAGGLDFCEATKEKQRRQRSVKKPSVPYRSGGQPCYGQRRAEHYLTP